MMKTLNKPNTLWIPGRWLEANFLMTFAAPCWHASSNYFKIKMM